jgi:uncharacterized protein (DUF2235 family)
MSELRRLIVCLDGTWNNRDDSTNVLHHFALTPECWARRVGNDTVTQLKFYREGVGTGSLDSITGGGFGFGLETNVRAAYNWLVQNYLDETAFTPADEIYIFGFSRGAFTARSLVGFISTCGLLRRGAPLTVNELWRTYCLIGRAREHHSGPLTDLFPDPPLDFRRITDLVWDPWLVRQKEALSPRPPGYLPGQRAATLNPTEALLVRWSRRVKITYLGVYDTVGAVGWDALAVPGIRSRLALHHNMRPTTLIQRCRHALAIDEHRSSFKHTPFVAYISGDTAESELKRIENDLGPRKDPQVDPVGALASAWTKRIEQRWFVGAHSNVGGGYASNPLAQQPLAWLLDGARDAGLVCDPLPKNPPPDRRLGPRDSFSEFATPFWTNVLRAKRTYRMIDPDPEIRAERRQRRESGAFMLVNVNEQVDPSAVEYYARQDTADPPPNLVEYARRKKSRGKDLTVLAEQKPRHPWMGSGVTPYITLAVWATLAAGGVFAVDLMFRIWGQDSPPAWWLAAAAAVITLVDWAESCHNFTMAARGASPARRAFLDSIYWTRALCVVLFIFGAIAGILSVAIRGGSAISVAEAWQRSLELAQYFGTVAVGAGLGVGLGVVFNHLYAKSSSPRAIVVVLAAIVSPLVIGVLITSGTFLAYEVWRIVAPALGIEPSTPSALAPGARFAGLLLLLQLSLIYFVNALTWAGEPMARARLGSIVPLQMCFTPAQIKGCLDRWCTMLRGHAAARCAMAAVVREALYRDIIGFIPVYSGTFMFGLWYGYSQLGWLSLQTAWWLLPLTALVADYAEDVCHLRCLRLHSRGHTPPLSLALLGSLMTWVKLVGFAAEGVLTLVIVAAATLRVYVVPTSYGWRGLIVLAISLVAGLIFGGLTVGSIAYRAITGASRREPDVSADSRTVSSLGESSEESVLRT